MSQIATKVHYQKQKILFLFFGVFNLVINIFLKDQEGEDQNKIMFFI